MIPDAAWRAPCRRTAAAVLDPATGARALPRLLPAPLPRMELGAAGARSPIPPNWNPPVPAEEGLCECSRDATNMVKRFVGHNLALVQQRLVLS